MPAGGLRGRRVHSAMYARAVDDAGARLRELRHEEWEKLGLAALDPRAGRHRNAGSTFCRAAAHARRFRRRGSGRSSSLASVGSRRPTRRGTRRVRDPRSPEVRVAGGHDGEALRHGRRIRGWLGEPDGGSLEARIRPAAAELEALASELTDGGLELDPACAVACRRLLSDLGESPLLNAARPPEELRSRVRQIRAGFRPCRPAA